MADLLVVGADPLLRQRIGTAVLGLSPRFLVALPEQLNMADVALIRFPDYRYSALGLARQLPFIAFGPPAYLVDAFELGARDYLKEPWDIAELAYRLAGWRLAGDSLRLGDNIVFESRELIGPAGRSRLSEAAANVLEILVKAAGMKVSRTALSQQLWPHLPSASRNLDVLISQLRRELRRVSGDPNFPQIRSVRGFGYQVVLQSVLCKTCGHISLAANS